jgi:hypothetical protein
MPNYWHDALVSFGDALVSFGDRCEAFLSFIDTALTATSAPDKPAQEQPDKKRPRTGEVERIIDDIDDIEDIDSEDERAGSPAKRPKTKAKAKDKHIVVQDIEDEPDPLPPVVVKIEKNLPVQPVLQEPTRTMQYVLEQANVQGFERVNIAFAALFNQTPKILVRVENDKASFYHGSFNLFAREAAPGRYMGQQVEDTMNLILKEQMFIELDIDRLLASKYKLTAVMCVKVEGELVIVIPMLGICHEQMTIKHKEMTKQAKKKNATQFAYYSSEDIFANEKKPPVSYLLRSNHAKIFEILSQCNDYANFDDFGTFV